MLSKVSLRKVSSWVVVAMTVAFSVTAQAQLVNSGSASVVFSATGTAGMKFDGKTSDLEVREGKSDGVVRVNVTLKNLDTGIALRDKHMKEKYLEVEKHPTASFAFVRKDVRFPEAGKSSSGEVSGTFTVHGVTKAKKVKYNATKDGDTYKVDCTFDVDMKEHDVNVPSYLGVTVQQNVVVAVKFALKD